MSDDKLADALEYAAVTEWPFAASDWLRNEGREIVAEELGLFTLLDLANNKEYVSDRAAYAAGQRDAAREIAKKIIRTSRGHEHNMWIGMSHAAHIARSYANEESIRRGFDQVTRIEDETMPWVTEEDR